jgi:biopolymer transport protein ExbB
MKSSRLLVLCLFSLTAAHAESPALEENPLSFYSTFSEEENAQEDTASLDEELFLLDEEFEDLQAELSELDDAMRQQEENTAIPSAVKPLAIDISEPLNPLETPIALEIIEEHAQDKTQTPLQPAMANVFEESSEQATPTADRTAMKQEEHIAALPQEGDSPAILSIESSSTEMQPDLDVELDLKRAFAGSPFIYILLFGMSVFSVTIWLYSLMSLKKTANVPQHLLTTLQSNLNGNHFDEALSLCNSQNALLCKMVASGIQSRKYGLNAMVESMKAEGKRSSTSFWQKIGLLNDVAVLAPMLGLLGTVLGMFYAFYDVNRSMESITALFDGLGISVGTTVAGLVVAILALILHSTAKYRLIRVLSQVENDAHRVAALIDNHTSLYTIDSK